MKRFLLFICFFTVTNISFLSAQNAFNSPSIFETFDDALVNANVSVLDSLTHTHLTMGHSNGWLQDKNNLLETLSSQFIVYRSITLKSLPEITYQNKILVVSRRDIDVIGVVSEKEFNVRLNVLETWIYQDEHWQLLARQSVNRKE